MIHIILRLITILVCNKHIREGLAPIDKQEIDGLLTKAEGMNTSLAEDLAIDEVPKYDHATLDAVIDMIRGVRNDWRAHQKFDKGDAAAYLMGLTEELKGKQP